MLTPMRKDKSFSISKRNPFQRIIMHLVSSFLRPGICVAHHYNHHHHHNDHHNDHHSSFRVQRHALLMASTLLIVMFLSQCHGVGYSYARFVGPVSGPEHEILVRDEINGGSRVDYIAHPEYQFAYGVEDSETQVLQNRKETRNGDEVNGVYSVVEPDGTLRIVKYTADNLNGFQAEVITNGVATIHGQNDEAIKDNGRVNWHVETGHKDDDGRNIENENDYEVHESVEDQSDSDNASYDNVGDDDDNDNDDDNDDKLTAYDEEETSEADAYSDESVHDDNDDDNDDDDDD